MSRWINRTALPITLSLPNLLDERRMPHDDAEWLDVAVPAGALFTYDTTAEGAAWLASQLTNSELDTLEE